MFSEQPLSRPKVVRLKRVFHAPLSEVTDIDCFKLLHFALAKYCTVYDFPFPELENVLLLNYGVLLKNIVDFVLKKQSYNARRFSTLLSSKDDVLYKVEMIFLMEVCPEAMQLGSQGQSFCFKD